MFLFFIYRLKFLFFFSFAVVRNKISKGKLFLNLWLFPFLLKQSKLSKILLGGCAWYMKTPNKGENVQCLVFSANKEPVKMAYSLTLDFYIVSINNSTVLHLSTRLFFSIWFTSVFKLQIGSCSAAVIWGNQWLKAATLP